MCRYQASIAVTDRSKIEEAKNRLNRLCRGEEEDGYKIKLKVECEQVTAVVTDPQISFNNDLDLSWWVKSFLGIHPTLQVGARLLTA